jgi:periplasmic protein TonB
MRTHGPAFLLSALIHLGLLALVFAGVSMMPQKGPPQERLAISLRMFQPPPPSPEVQAQTPPPAEPVVEVSPEPEAEQTPPPLTQEPPPPPKPKPIPKPIPKPVPKPRPQRIVKPPPPAPKPASAEPVQQTPAQPPVEQQPVQATPAPRPQAEESLLRRVEEAYKITLRKAIEAHKGYPRRAIRLHQEGEIVVGFTIRRDGVIVDLRVVESSGSALLDRAALEAVRRVDGTLPFPDGIERSDWSFTLPISYTLR